MPVRVTSNVIDVQPREGNIIYTVFKLSGSYTISNTDPKFYSCEISIKIYINDKLRDTLSTSVVVEPNTESTHDYTYEMTFRVKGTYNIYTDVNIERVREIA
jgi:hypothetical protein